MLQDFDRSIGKNESELNLVIEKMEQTRAEILAAVAVYLKDEFPKIARRIATEDTDTFDALTDRRLQNLRDRVREIESHAEQIAGEEFASVELWWHLQPQRQERLVRGTGEDNQTFGPPLRYCLGRLGPVLTQYGYLTTPGSDPSAHHPWAAPTEHANQDGSPAFYHPDNHRLDWPEYLETPIEKYADLVTDGERLWVEGEELKRQIQIKAACIKWDALQ